MKPQTARIARVKKNHSNGFMLELLKVWSRRHWNLLDEMDPRSVVEACRVP
jgi:hypothetical protein